MKAIYFASVRERIGVTDEVLAPPPEVRSVADLMDWLKGRGENYADAFAGTVRAAIDRGHVGLDAPIAGAREIAFFPPMTGG